MELICDLNKIISSLSHRALYKENKLREAESQKLKLEFAIADKDEAINYILKHTSGTFRPCVVYDSNDSLDLKETKKAWEARLSKKAIAAVPVAPPASAS